MKKVNIILEVPVLNLSCELKVPLFMKIKALLPLLVDIIISLSNNVYQSSGEEHLCSINKQKILDDEQTLDYYLIKNGEHLMLL